MSYLAPKSKGSSAWLPTQVVYGVDCAAPDPKDWVPFGQMVDKQEQSKTAASTKSAPKIGLPE